MTPTDLYSAALASLTSARAAMLSAEWQAELDNETPADRLASSQALIAVQQAILNLTNASLSNIADQMVANGADLSKNTAALNQALKDITRVKTIIGGAASLVATVAKILPAL